MPSAATGGSTNDAYARAYLGPDTPIEADAVTVSPYLGLATMSAFTSRAHEVGACTFVVTRSSNPEGQTIQQCSGQGIYPNAPRTSA